MFSRYVRILFPFCILALLVASCEKLTPQQKHFQNAYNAYKSGDFATALLYLQPLVDSGHPGAELLLGKMYANGEGIPADIGKSELLRNLAAIQIYSKHNLTPGEMDQSQDTLKSISDRLDYYVGAADGKKTPEQDLSKVLDSVGIKGLPGLDKINADPDADAPDVGLVIPHEESAQSQAEPAPTQDSSSAGESSTPAAGPRTAETAVALSSDSRRTDQISLGMLRQAADGGDPMAMSLLAAAYRKGYYGLVSNAVLSVQWAARAKEARRNRKGAIPIEKDPLPQLIVCLAAGLVLIGLGGWRWRASRSW